MLSGAAALDAYLDCRPAPPEDEPSSCATASSTTNMPSSAERTRRAVDAVLLSEHDEGPASPSEDRNTGPSPSDGLLTA